MCIGKLTAHSHPSPPSGLKIKNTKWFYINNFVGWLRTDNMCTYEQTSCLPSVINQPCCQSICQLVWCTNSEKIGGFPSDICIKTYFVPRCSVTDSNPIKSRFSVLHRSRFYFDRIRLLLSPLPSPTHLPTWIQKIVVRRTILHAGNCGRLYFKISIQALLVHWWGWLESNPVLKSLDLVQLGTGYTILGLQ